MISIYTTVTNPDERMDPWKEALENYCDLADEVIVVNGGKPIEYNNEKVRFIDYPWPIDWEWEELALHFNRGLDECKGEWAIKMDIDMFFHERDFKRIKSFLKDCGDMPVAGFLRENIITTNRVYPRSGQLVAINKGKYKDTIKHGSVIGEITERDIPVFVKEEKDGLYFGERTKIRIPEDIRMYNYGYFFRTKEVARKIWSKYYVPWNKVIKKDEIKEDGFDLFLWTTLNRTKLAVKKIGIEDHPVHIREKVKNITPEQLGYNCWGMKL